MTHLHLLLIDGEVCEADVPAAVLALESGGRFPLLAGHCRPERDELAEVLGDGLLAELLRSDRPIVVDTREYGYLFLGDG